MVQRAVNNLKKKPELVKKYSKQIEKYTANLFEVPNLFFAEASVEESRKALILMRKYGLLPRDAIHASIVLTGIKNIITVDEDFVKVKEINVYTCNPKAFQNKEIM